MLRALLPITPGMVVEMRATLPHGLGRCPAVRLNPSVEYPSVLLCDAVAAGDRRLRVLRVAGA